MKVEKAVKTKVLRIHLETKTSGGGSKLNECGGCGRSGGVREASLAAGWKLLG